MLLARVAPNSTCTDLGMGECIPFTCNFRYAHNLRPSMSFYGSVVVFVMVEMQGFHSALCLRAFKSGFEIARMFEFMPFWAGKGICAQ